MNNFNHLHQRIFSNNGDLFSPLKICTYSKCNQNKRQTLEVFFWSCLEIGCRHGITVLCGASSAQAVGVPHLNDGILGRFEFLRSSPAFFFQLCSWLLQTLTIGFTAKKVGSKMMDEIHLFFDNEDTLVRWVWRHWKSYHKHFFSKQKWIKCVYPDSFCTIYRLQKQFPFRKCKIL